MVRSKAEAEAQVAWEEVVRLVSDTWAPVQD